MHRMVTCIIENEFVGHSVSFSIFKCNMFQEKSNKLQVMPSREAILVKPFSSYAHWHN